MEHPGLLQGQRTAYKKPALIIQGGQKSLVQEKMETSLAVPNERASYLKLFN